MTDGQGEEMRSHVHQKFLIEHIVSANACSTLRKKCNMYGVTYLLAVAL